MEIKEQGIQQNGQSTRLLACERETHIYIDDDTNEWIADTSIQKDIRKFQKQGWESLYCQKYEDGSVMAMCFKAPRNAIAIRNPNKKRIVSNEQKAAASERMQKYHQKPITNDRF